MVRKLLVLAVVAGSVATFVRKRRQDEADHWHDATSAIDLR